MLYLETVNNNDVHFLVRVIIVFSTNFVREIHLMAEYQRLDCCCLLRQCGAKQSCSLS